LTVKRDFDEHLMTALDMGCSRISPDAAVNINISICFNVLKVKKMDKSKKPK
jgi:hypothetical protein